MTALGRAFQGHESVDPHGQAEFAEAAPGASGESRGSKRCENLARWIELLLVNLLAAAPGSSGFAEADDAAAEVVARARGFRENGPIVSGRPDAARARTREAIRPGHIEKEHAARPQRAEYAAEEAVERAPASVVQDLADGGHGVALGQPDRPQIGGDEGRAGRVSSCEADELGGSVHAEHIVAAAVQDTRPASAAAAEIDYEAAGYSMARQGVEQAGDGAEKMRAEAGIVNIGEVSAVHFEVVQPVTEIMAHARMKIPTDMMEPAAKLIRGLGLPKDIISAEQLACAAWAAAVGRKVAVHTRAARLVGRRLVVEVEDAIWRRQLLALAPHIVNNLAKALGPSLVEDLEFRIMPRKREPQRAASSAPADEAEAILDPVLRSIYRTSRKRAAGE